MNLSSIKNITLKLLYKKQCGTCRPYISDLQMLDFDIHNVCPYLIDIYIAGAISSYLFSKDRKEPTKKETYHHIESERNNIEVILMCSDDEVYDYFYIWYILSNRVLEEIKDESL